MDLSVQQQPVLPIDVFLLCTLVQQPVLPLNFSVLQQAVFSLDVSVLGSLCCSWTCLFQSSLFSPCLFYISQCCPWKCLFYISLIRPWRCLFYCIAAYVAPECVCSMCSLDMPVSQPSVLPKDVCSTTAYDIPDVSILHRPLSSLDVCGQQKFVLSLSLNFTCSVNISCAAIKTHFFIYFYFYYIYNF
jgi:hypothetical protein